MSMESDNSKDKTNRKKVMAVLMALAMELFLIMRVDDAGDLYFFSSEDNFILFSVAWGGLLMLIMGVNKKSLPFQHGNRLYNICELLGSMCFSIITIAGKFYINEMSFRPHNILSGTLSSVKYIIVFVGGLLLYAYLIELIYLGIDWVAKTGDPDSDCFMRKIVDGQYVFVKSALFILVIWLPQLLIRYPGAMFFDAWTSLHHYWNPELWTSQHPVVYTLLLGKMTDWGMSLGHFEWGIFAIIVGQTVLHILVMAYTLSVMQKYKIRWEWRLISLCFYAFLPIFVAYATTAIIDSGYCVFFLLLFAELFSMIKDADSFVHSPRHCILLVLSCAGLFLRYNGIYILLIIVFSLIVYGFLAGLKKTIHPLPIFFAAGLILITAVMAQLATTAVTDHYTAKNVSSRAKHALIIQQLARCITEHPESFSEADREDIETVMRLQLETIAEKYNPYTFDTIKGRFNVNASHEEMARFRAVWLRMLKTHPLTCMNATFQQNYFLFSILSENSKYYIDFRNGMVNDKAEWDYSSLYTASELRKAAHEKIYNYYVDFEKIPVLGLLADQAIYTIILFVSSLVCISAKKKKMMILIMPLLATLGIAFLGPACLNHPRYMYPLIYCMPFMVCAIASDMNSNGS